MSAIHERDDHDGGFDLAHTLLGIYECSLVPEKYDQLTSIFEGWLNDDPNMIELGLLESHSETIWTKLADQLVERESGYASDNPDWIFNATELAGHRANDEFAQLSKTLHIDDQSRLQRWARDGASAEILVRVAAKDPEEANFALVMIRRDGDSLRAYRMKNMINDEAVALVRNAFNLSASELPVLRGLVAGETLKEIADGLGKSIHTVRTQVKSITSKFGVSRQGELTTAISTIQRYTHSRQSDPAERSATTLMLDDGRILEFDRYGQTGGIPVLYFHDFSYSRRWTDHMKDCARSAGLMVYAMSRSGYAHSTATALQGPALARRHVEDYRALMRQLGLGSAHMLAFGTGFGIACQLASRYPASTLSMTGLNVYPPILSHGDAMQFPKGMFRAGALAAFYAPKTSALIAKYATRRAILSAKMEELDKLTGAQVDTADFNAEFFQRYLRPNLEDLRTGRGEGVWRDCTLLTVDWLSAPAPKKTQILRHRDYPFSNHATSETLARRLRVPFRSIDRPFRSMPFDFSDITALIAANHA